MKKIDDLNDQNPITGGIDDGIGDLFNNKIYYMAPSEVLTSGSTKFALKSTSTPMVPATTSSQNVPLNGESLENMIGLSDLVYSSLDPNHTLPPKNSKFTVNNVDYEVIEVEDGSSGYEGMALLDRSSNAIIVVNRGTQSGDSFGTDADMAFNTVNNQWQDALALAQLAANDATTLGASAIYTTGHSLGGTLAQMQAAYFGWQGYTFNAYGAGEVYSQLGLAISPSASIKNYRTMFDLVSDASTQIGDTPITIETAYDSVVLDDFYSNHWSTGLDLLFTIGKDHGLSNFHGDSDPAGNVQGTGNNTYTLAPGFANPVSGQMAALAQDIVSSFGELIHLGLESKIGPFTSGDLTLQQSAQELQQFINNEPQSGIKAIVPSDPSLLSNALNPDASNDAYRASLSALSPVVLQGLDSSSYANASLWLPGQATGLTSDYLTARNDMVQAMIAMAGQGQVQGGSGTSNDANTYVYSDLNLSSGPMYTLNGLGSQVYDIIFASNVNTALDVTSGSYAELFGGSGNDTLYGSAIGSTLQGGGGNDLYVIDGGGTGVDYILDTDGSGEIEWKFADGSAETLTGGDDQAGTSSWKSSDGLITYTEGLAADGSTELEIRSGNKIVSVDDFTNGEFGITLNTNASAPEGASNLGALRDQGLSGNTDIPDGADYVYSNDADSGPVDSIYGADSSNNNFGNEIFGEGNASYIYTGNGNNTAVLGDYFNQATVPVASPLSATIQGGSGNQDLIGVGNGTETITGGAVGADTAAETYIDGGGATGLLAGGGQNSVIFGGTGADTLIASSSDGSSLSGFNPNTFEIAGVSFWGDAYSTELDENNDPYYQTALPKTSWAETSSDDVQVNLSLYQSDGTFATPFGLLGSSLDSGVADGSATLPGSELIGGTGDDWLIGNAGDDTIIGGNPADTVAGVVDEVLVGGAGADVIYGGGGTELIYADMPPGAASDWADLDSNDADTIYGGAGTDYIYGSGGNDLIYGGSGTSIIRVGNGNSYVDAGNGHASIYGGSGSDTIVADGAAALVQAGDGDAYIVVSDGQSTITAGAGDDTIEAAGGNALITEGSGKTTLIAGTSTGLDTVQSNSGNTVLQLVDGLTESTLVTRDVNEDLVLSDSGFDTQITVSGYFSNASGVSVQFEDGTTWGTTEILAASMTPRTDGGNDTLVGSNGNDSITAGYGDTSIVGISGDNTLIGGAGDDTIQGGNGADTIEGGSGTTLIMGGTGVESYVYNLGDGSDTIVENTSASGADTFQFGAGISSSDVTYTYDSTSDILVIGFGALSGATVTVQDLAATQPGQHQITAFSFADGTTLTQLQVIQMAVAIDGTTGNDSLAGSAGPDYFDGLSGNDTEVGGGGDDTFVFNSGYGRLEINESYTSGQQPVLQLGAGIAASALRVTTDGTNLMLADGVSGDEIILDKADWLAGNGVAAVQFADGSTLTASQLVQLSKEIGGTTGNDTLEGTAGADLIDGRGGTDYAIGGGGDDTFVFNAGYGTLEIDEYGSQSSVLQMGPGITVSALNVARTANGNSIVLTDGINGDQVYIDNTALDATPSNNGPYGVQKVVFSDGTALTLEQLIQMASEVNGTAGDDTIEGTTQADLIDGKGGNDSIDGDGGNDTFVFNAGYGSLVINEYGSQQSVLQLGPGLAASDLKMAPSADGTSLVMTDGISGDQITFYDAISGFNVNAGQSYGVQEVAFADGTTMTFAQLAYPATGTIGNDTLEGTAGADLIDGKGGNDYAIGNGGNDTFVFNSGYGSLEINEYNPVTQQATLQLGSGIMASSLSATQDRYGDVVLADGVSGDQITLDEAAEGNGTYGVQVVTFADGTSMTGAQLIQLSREINGTTGNDTLQASTSELRYGTYVFDGKGGNDVDIAYGGFDTFVFDAGYGHLEINNEVEAFVPQAVLQLGAGITSSEIRVTTNGSDLILTDGIAGDQVVLDDMWQTFAPISSAPADFYGIGTVQFADGTTLTSAQLAQMEMTGTTGSDAIYGTSGADLIDGKGGNDTVSGDGGSDTFVFDAGYGDLTIGEYDATNADDPILEFGAGITASALHVSTNGTEWFLTDGISGDQITLYQEYSSDGFAVSAVQFADGTTLTAAQLIQMEMTGTTGSDTIYGMSGADLIDGKGGNDTVIGNGGSDTFVFNAGYGNLSIDELSTSGQQPVLQLGPGITASALHVTSDGNNLYLTDGVNGDQITLDYEMASLDGNVGSASSPYGVAVVTLADGSTLTAAQLIQMETTGTTGNDTLFGMPGADLIDGRGGNDSVNGEGGNDTFVFDAGYGLLTINETCSSGQQPVLQLGSGITASVLKVTTDGTNLMLTDGISGDQITFDGMWSSGTQGVAVVQFSDGTSLTAARLMQMEMTGTTGNDTITGTSDADLIDGKSGNDSVIGNGGSDTFVFDSGYGQLTINEVYTNGQNPVLQLGAGITASALHVTESNNNLIVTDDASGDQITLDGMWSNNNDGVSAVDFADGTSITGAQLVEMEMSGTTGSDTITGTSGADLVDGKGGTDSVIGGGGDDTFVFNSGYGQLTINEVYKSDQMPVLTLGDGITASSLHATKSGNSLVLTDGVSGDQVALINMWSTSTDGVASLQLSDGTVLTRNQIIALEMTGTTGNDTITGTSGADLIDGKGGTDSITGGGGNDAFIFNSGYGKLTINEAYKSSQTPVLKLGTGITASALHATKSGNNLILTDGTSGDQIILINMWSTSTDGVASLQLSDGTVLTRNQIIALEMTGTTGNDTITGTSGADLIDGKGGTDSVTGGGGSDTFVFSSGYGKLTINEAYTSGQAPVLKLGAGITSSTLHVAESGNNLVLTDGASGDKITLVGMWTTSTDGVATVQFSNGTSLTRSQLIQMGTAAGSALVEARQVQEEPSAPGNGGSVTGGSGNDALVADTANGSLIASSAQAETTATSMTAMVTMDRSPTIVSPDATVESSNDSETPADPPAWTHIVAGSALARQINMLTHAMASYTGSDLGAETTMPITHAISGDLMLHAAA